MRAIPTVLACVVVAACGPEPEFMEATIDGALFQAERALCFYSQGELEVHGHRSTGADTRRAIEVSNLPITGPATLALGEDGPRGFVMDQDAFGWDTHVGYATTETLTGTITVTEFGGGRCSGTFSFTAVMVHNSRGPVTADTLEVTAGSWTAEVF